MKKFFRIFIVTFSILNIQIIYPHCETLNLIEEKLQDIGISEEYTNNIINYINNLNLTTEERKEVIENSQSIFEIIQDSKGYENLSFSEIMNIYEEILNISKDLDIDIEVDFYNKEVEVIDKHNKETLIKCNVDEAKKYYENYKDLSIDLDEYSNLIEYVSNNESNLNSIDGIEKEIAYEDKYGNIESDLANENNNNDISSNKGEITSNNNTARQDSNKIINKSVETTAKNANRVLSIIFIVMVACIILSIIIGKIIAMRKYKKLK